MTNGSFFKKLGLCFLFCFTVSCARLSSTTNEGMAQGTSDSDLCSLQDLSLPEADILIHDPVVETLLPLPIEASGRIIAAIGDIHGDLGVLQTALKKAGATDVTGRWIGGSMIVVQTGDFIDRGDDDKSVFDYLENLHRMAQFSGGAVYVLNGNHELMNAEGVCSYASEKSIRDFSGSCGKSRRTAFMPGGPYALKLAGHFTVLLIDGTVFVHGGVTPEQVAIGLDILNQGVSDWLSGKTRDLPYEAESMTWLRTYSSSEDEESCALLIKTLAALHAERMVVGHTVQSHINSACNEKVWRIDTGMSRAYYGGPVEVLMIEENRVYVR